VAQQSSLQLSPHLCLKRQRIHDTQTLFLYLAKTTAAAIVTRHHIIRRMASSVTQPSAVPKEQLESFQEHFNKSTRILALLGAGLSASSGLPTFRGAGGMWRTHDATSLATPEAFQRDPGLVWQFYSYRRHMALKAKPNPAHYALAELARRKKDFITLSQNVDGAYTRQTSPPPTLYLLTTPQASHHAPNTPPRSSNSSTARSST
jgi:hypothetical protein